MSKIKFSNAKPPNDRKGRVGLVYARVSSKRQETEGGGLESQEGRCASDLKSIGVPHHKSFLDSYTGGGDFMKRPAMRDLLAYIDRNPQLKFIVVFDDLKRFARDVEFHLKLRAAFKIRDVELRCLNYNFDESPEGRFSEVVFAAQAELERHQNSRQVIQKQKARLELGYWAFGSKKGYRMVKDPLHGTLAVPDEIEAPLLKIALEGFAHGKFVRKIDVCIFLLENNFWKGVAPERYIDNLTTILKDPFYAGFIDYPAWEVPRRRGHHKGIISEEVFQLIQKRLSRETGTARIRKDMSDDFPLRGLVLCDFCNKPLTGAWSKGHTKRYAYYFCQQPNCDAYRVNIKKEIIENQFNAVLEKNKLKIEVEMAVKFIFDDVWQEETGKLAQREKEREERKMELQKQIKELTNMARSAKSATLREVYENQIEETVSQLEEYKTKTISQVDLSIPYRTSVDKAMTFLKNPSDAWQEMNTKDKQQLFYFIFEVRLPYNHKDGYRTEKSPSSTRLFEDFTGVITLNVEMARLNSRV